LETKLTLKLGERNDCGLDEGPEKTGLPDPATNGGFFLFLSASKSIFGRIYRSIVAKKEISRDWNRI
jgi:hypothetical protein